ncbi:MAG: hypothetical protein V4454_10775 [Pseudomonadota bacterium]
MTSTLVADHQMDVSARSGGVDRGHLPAEKAVQVMWPARRA